VDRNILLVEPGYKTKFPPMGLMKISTYHKMLGDKVFFVKGINGKVADKEYWDRIYISTVFTYNWKVTVETINYYKSVVKNDITRIKIGGILASLMPKDLWQETGIAPVEGLLDKPGMLDDGNSTIVDDLIPDYELFDGTEHKYSLIADSYFGYVTRGCVRDCKFCAVNILEPKFLDKNGLKDYIERIKSTHGERKNLVLFDNNIIASDRFESIINDIVDLGFHRGAKLNRSLRYVDFNQGTDARLVNKKVASLLAKIQLKPLRIAFDFLGMQKVYSEAIRLAAGYGIRNLSNYILYNYKDTPEDLWKRLKINIDLNKELDLQIYSFPMKYIPLKSKDRSFIDEPNWNWQYVRTIQRITNVLKGAVMHSESFFHRAFGENVQEFQKILYMPEKILMNRGMDIGPDERDWVHKLDNLSDNEKTELIAILCKYRKTKELAYAYSQLNNQKIKNILEYYLDDQAIAQQHLMLVN
jgi:hypothetical protein